jgi:YfiH family protein
MTEETAEDDVPLYVVTDWADRFSWLFAGITHAGSGTDPFDLRLFGEPASGRAPARWSDLLQASAFETIVHAHQLHETRIVIHDRVGRGVRETEGGADGHATAESGVLLAVTVADCVPVYLLDADARAVALLHAGWRGTAAGILPRGITLFGKRWGTDPGRLLVHLGPAICGACYEVGPEVFSALGVEAPAHPAPIDVREVLAQQANAAGVPSESITVSGLCTLCGDGNLFSHRGGRSERQVAVLGIRA